MTSLTLKAMRHQLPVLMLLGSCLNATGAMAAEDPPARPDYSGYLTDKDGQLVRNGYHQCWRTVEWRPELALAECEPQFVQIRKKLERELEQKKKKPPRDVKPVVAEEKPADGRSGMDMMMETPPPVEAGTVGVAGAPLGGLASKPLPPPQRYELQAVFMPLVLNSDTSFRFGDDKLTPEGREAVMILAASLKNRNLQELGITIIGHTDRVGSPQANLSLSKRRAMAVKQLLVEQELPADRIQVEGRGSSQPVTQREDCPDKLVKCELIDCLRPDRRVELQVRGKVESGKKLVPVAEPADNPPPAPAPAPAPAP